ncbi:SIR2 family protein [Streptococcus suis]|uniref:SIR2 family protein n=1 Tax=Streptococcus suis TaxID=1307 RepID=A0A4T2GNE7_STRSU|nr:SIR2 family protein [Streptococcus suis]MBM7269697.1 SIR2 family protein [Streptococcus suis]TII00453.1 SIR2 family protein [Streptococcus suis]
MFFFFFDDIDKTKENQIEYHYLSRASKFGVERDDTGAVNFYDSNGILEKQNSNDSSEDEFQMIDFKRLISEKIRKIVYGEKYSNVVFLAGAGASVTPDRNPEYGKTVKMIADNIFEELHKSTENIYTLEELATQCRYKDGNILAGNESESTTSPKLADDFNLEDFLSTLFHYRPYVPDDNIEDFNKTIDKILKLIKKNTNYSYDSKVLKHGALLNFLSKLSEKGGNKFSVVTTNYDVLIEEAGAENNFVIFDGFNFTPLPKFDSNMFEWNLVKEVQNVNTREVEYKDKTFNLVKIHGSLTWEKQDNGDIVRKNKDNITETDKMVMIFPSSDKFAQSYQEPYFELFTKFQELIKRPNTLLISSGFSFADDHISKMVTQALKNNSSLKLLVTDFNIDPNREWNGDNNQYSKIDESNSKYNQNWAELVRLMDEGYPISFLKATMNSDLVDYLSGRYLNDEN